MGSSNAFSLELRAAPQVGIPVWYRNLEKEQALVRELQLLLKGNDVLIKPPLNSC